MGEEYRHNDSCREEEDYRRDRRRRRDPCDEIEDCGIYESKELCCGKDDDWDLGSWLPILIIVFILCGGFSWFGGGNRNDCNDNNEGWGGWLLILLVVFLLFNQGDGKKGGFLGGLF